MTSTYRLDTVKEKIKSCSPLSTFKVGASETKATDAREVVVTPRLERKRKNLSPQEEDKKEEKRKEASEKGKKVNNLL